jgi:hypothetical protein
MTNEPKKKKKLPVLIASGDENQDWIKHANPKAAAEEIEIHEMLARKYAAEREGRTKPE